MNEFTITKTFQMKTGKRQFPITLGLSEIIDRKEIMKNVETELKEKENYKPELTIYERAELGKELIEASKNGNLEKVKELINKGADINYKDERGNTALILSILNKYDEIFKLLIEKGADVDIINSNNNTALDLLSNSLYCYLGTITSITTNHNNYLNIKILLEKSNSVPSESYKNILYFLHYESEYPYIVDLIKLAIQKGADVNLRYDDLIGTTALIEAVKANDINFTKFLLDHGARIDIKDYEGTDVVAYINSVEMNSLFIDRNLIKVTWQKLLLNMNLTTLIKYYFKKIKRVSK